MADKPKPHTTCALTSEELRRTMAILEPMYDLVRVVDPSVTQGCTLTADGQLDLPHRCYDLLCKGRRCQNCISARTVAHKESVSKFEFVGEDAFFISTQYVEVDGEPRSLEMVRQIRDTALLGVGSGDSGHSDLRDLAQKDSNERYLDPATGALTRAYIDEGIGALRGSKLALMRIAGLAGTNSVRQVAQTLLKGIRNVDTLIRYRDDTFAIVFEGIPRHLVAQRLEQIREQVMNTLVERGDAESSDVFVGAVMGDDTIAALLARAEVALEQASTGTLPLVIEDDGPTAQEQASLVGEVPTPGQRQSTVDALTGLPAPHVFRKLLQERIDRLDPDQGHLYVVHLDIENFKAFNRAYGLPEGDLLLVEFAQALSKEFDRCLITRAGTDMFDIAARGHITRHIEALRARLAELRRDVALELKAGVYEVRTTYASAPNAVDLAKIACDSIKGKYDLSIREFDTKLEHAINVRTYIVETLDEALQKDYIRPYYQAIVRPFTGHACAAEALSRWEDPVMGLLSPADVIPTLEQHHLIHKHDIHMVRCACQDLRHKMDKGEAVVPVSVNLSRLDFELCDIFAEVEACVERYGIDRSLIGIEVTESTLDQANSVFRPQIERFRSAGYEIWMDDFGSGYSSLNLLKDYRFDVLKIDMAFLHGLEHNHNSKEIISSIVDMAKRIGIRTLAEGVETEAQFAFLRNIGCEMIQGYLFSRPAPFEQIDFGATVGIESLCEREYFDSIGRVNLLSQQTADAVNPAGDDTARSMPLAVLEYKDGQLSILTANESYLGRLKELGIPDTSAAMSRVNARDSEALKRLADIAQHYGDVSGEHMATYEFGGAEQNTSVQFVARNGDAAAFLIAPQR